MKLIRGTAVLAVPLFLSACGVPGTRLRELPPDAAQIHVNLQEGGFLDCGPEVLAAILELNGQPADIAEISRAVAEKSRGGTNPLHMVAYAASHGLRALAAPGASLRHLRAGLDLGIPPVVMVQVGPFTWHYFLVIGAPAGQVVCADYGKGGWIFTETDFVRMWDRTGHYTLFIAPDVSKIPYTEDDLLSQLDEPPIPFEGIDGATHLKFGLMYEKHGHKRLAKIEYERALAADSSQVVAALGLGNLLYGEGKFADAAEAFRRGAHAGGACANNLAFILTEHLGRHELARLWALRARGQSVRLSEAWFQALDTEALASYRQRRWKAAEDLWVQAAVAGTGNGRKAWRAACLAGAARAAAADGRPSDALDHLAGAVADGLAESEAASVRKEIARHSR